MGISVFGGSFNPVHMGHYEIVRQTLQLDYVSKIIVVPAYQNPLKGKTPAAPESTRLKMLYATFSEFKSVEISLYELQKRETSYTYRTLEHFKALFPDDQLYLVIGEDSYHSFPQWTNIDRVLQLSTPLVYPRITAKEEKSYQNADSYKTAVKWLDISIPDISSTAVRNSSIEEIEKNNWLHPDALKYWKEYLNENYQQ